MAALAGVDDEDCGVDYELGHLDEALTKSRSSFKTMFNKGVKYQAYLNRVVETKRINNDEENMETLQINDDDQDDDDNLYPFDSFNALEALGFSVYDNPFMDISNLLTSTSGVCDITKTTLEDMTKQSKLGEDLCYIDDSEDTENEENEESSHGITEVSTSLIQKIPARRYPSTVVYSMTKDPEPMDNESVQLPVSTRHWIERIVRNRLEKLKSERSFDGLSGTKYKEFTERLTENTRQFLLLQLKAKIVDSSIDSSTSSDDDS